VASGTGLVTTTFICGRTGAKVQVVPWGVPAARHGPDCRATEGRPPSGQMVNGRINGVAANPSEVFGDLLSSLQPERMQHSVAVGRKVASVAHLVPAHLRSDLIAAGTLHDIGYSHPTTGFHPIDGARYLADLGFTSLVCHLVAHHSASSIEAEERGINISVFDEFRISDAGICGMDGVGRAHSVLWWADMTTGPQGQDVVVADRLDEICARYGPTDPVTRFVGRARQELTNAGQSPMGSIHVPG
jgi:hypothetical protein